MRLFNAYLALASDSLDDIEQLRIATENRVRMLTRNKEDSDGEMRGLGLDERSPEVAQAMAMLDGLKALENGQTLAIKREIRKSPFAGWVKRSKGIGEKQAARLISVLGDPYWNDLYDRPRTVSELWAYCGYAVNGGIAQRRKKGERANWSAKAKSRAYLIAEACVKAGVRKTDDAEAAFTPDTRVAISEYGEIYLARREQTWERVHTTECVRCGPAGKPAQPGSPLSSAHQHNDALRIVAKSVLKDIWLEARAAHGVVDIDERLAA